MKLNATKKEYVVAGHDVNMFFFVFFKKYFEFVYDLHMSLIFAFCQSLLWFPYSCVKNNFDLNQSTAATSTDKNVNFTTQTRFPAVQAVIWRHIQYSVCSSFFLSMNSCVSIVRFALILRLSGTSLEYEYENSLTAI